MQDNSKWLWLLGVVVLIVAVAGLFVAISAKNSAVDEDQVVREATAQLKGELSGLGGALKAGEEFQDREAKQAARDRARIKREVGSAVSGAKKKISRLSSEVGELQTQSASSEKSVSELKTSVSNLNKGQEDLEAEIKFLKRRLNKNGGT